jgi:hypothetical protein
VPALASDEIISAEFVESPPRYGYPQVPYVQAPYAQTVAVPQKKRRTWLLVVGLCVGLPIAGIALVVLIGWFYIATAEDLPVTEADRAVVLRAQDVAPQYPHEGFEVRPLREKFKKVRYMDGSHEVEYTYETPDGDPYPLQIYCTINIERNASDATTTHAANKVGGNIGISTAEGIKLVPRDDLFRWGSDSSMSMVYNQGAPLGHIFFARSDKHVVAIMLYGVYFENREHLEELLTPVLDRFKKYKP